MSDLVGRLRIKAGMIEMGELIAWGSDSALMREAADALEENAKLRAELERRAVPDAWKLAVDNVAGYAHLYNSGSGIIHEIRAEHARLLAAAPSAPKANEYRCRKCGEKTPPPEPYKAYVLCDCGYMYDICYCGYMTSATAAIAAARKGEG